MFVRVNGNTILNYPFDPNTLSELYPDINFPEELTNEILAQYNVYPVIEEPDPEYDLFNEEVISNPILLEGQWTVQKEVIALTLSARDEIIRKYTQIADERMLELIAEVDEYINLTGNNNPAVQEYRQSVADIKLTPGFPRIRQDQWPTKPW